MTATVARTVFEVVFGEVYHFPFGVVDPDAGD
jgi:hypothetical protein